MLKTGHMRGTTGNEADGLGSERDQDEDDGATGEGAGEVPRLHATFGPSTLIQLPGKELA